MEVKPQHIVDGAGDGAQYIVNEGGTVLPPSNSQTKNEVGIHWLRISFHKKHLQEIVKFLNFMFGNSDQDGYGLWSYEFRFKWENGASLNYDRDKERSQTVHLDRCTLDVPGSALDELHINDMLLLVAMCRVFEGKCTRIDVFFDDYRRHVTFEQLQEVARRGDYSGLRRYNIRESGIYQENGTDAMRHEVSFGNRGDYGNGKYIRWYDKELESGGDIKCDRWEVEFTQKKADIVFRKLSECEGKVDSFASLCGFIIAGCITFVHRTGDKNISRLEKYDWWEQIQKVLGDSVTIRVTRKKDSLSGKMEFIKRNVSPTLACLQKVFVNKRHFFRWLWDVCNDGESRMNPYTQHIAHEYQMSLSYNWSKLTELTEEQRKYELSKLSE